VAGFASGLTYGFSSEVIAPLAGGLGGVTQVALTNIGDTQSWFGKPWVAQIWPTNGELINTATGVGALVATAASYGGHGRFLASRPKLRQGALVYGIVTLGAGWLIPAMIRWLTASGVFGARRGTGGGRAAYFPNPPLRSQAAFGTGATQQANAQVFRRLFTAQ
jgi:hypothetical protein